MDKSSNLDETTISKLDETTNSNLDESSKCNEQTIEQTNEQTSNTAHEESVYRKIDLSSSFEVIKPETAKEFIDHRIVKKSPLTQRAFDRIVKSSISISNQLSVTTDWVIEETIDAGWQAPKAEWLKSRASSGRSSLAPSTPRERARQKIAQMEAQQ